uniref:Uncharacterized protein n=2 Tax=Caenorhabditis japonica TaxID=281687 RepID=A0A8R1DGT6_CAEJA
MQSSIPIAFLIVGVLAGVVELCGSVNSAPPTASENKTEGRKRRHVYNTEVIQIELQTTLKSVTDAEFSKIENVVGPAYEQLLDGAQHHVEVGGAVMKYTLIDADCGEAQLFARAIKDTTSFVTGATVTCNGQVSII